MALSDGPPHEYKNISGKKIKNIVRNNFFIKIL